MKLLFALLVLISFQVRAAEVQVPALRSPVVDLGEFLSESEEQVLSEKIYDIYTNKGPQITILTVRDLQGFEIEEFSIRVAEKWQLGSKEKDDGLLIVLSRAERKVRIEVGQGLEGDITDYDTAQFTRDIFPRYFKAGQFAEGFMQFLNWASDVFSAAEQGKPRLVKRAPKRTAFSLGEWVIVAVLAVIIGANSLFKKRPVLRGLFTGIGCSGISFLIGFPLLLIAVIFIFGVIFGLVGIGNALLASGNRSRYHGGYGGGGWGSGSSGGGWSGGGGGFSGGGSSGDW